MKENNEEQDNEIIDASEFDKVTDDGSLLKFCQDTRKNKKKLNDNTINVLAKQINNLIFNKNKKLSIATVFELSILILRKVDLSKLNDELKRYIHKCYIYEHLDFYDSCANNGKYFKNFKPVFEFVKNHKIAHKKWESFLTCYINLLRGFIIFLWNSEPLCATDFFNLKLINFKDTNSYNDLSFESFDHLIEILENYLNRDKNEDNKKQIVEAMYNILEFAPPKFLYKNTIVKLLSSLTYLTYFKNFDAGRIHKVIERLITLDGCKFSYALMILSYCKNNSVPGDIFKKAINHWAENKQDLFKSFSLKIPKKKLEELNKQGKNIADIENKYNKYIFTPSLINFIKQKFNFDENYDLGQVLKINFGEDNFAEGDNCDLEVIMYRLFFENYMLVPHKTEDVIKLFETTKMFLPPYGKSLKESFRSDFENIWDGLITYDFFEDMNTLAQDIIWKRWNNMEYLTLADLKIIALSSFQFGGLGNINKNHDTQYFWQGNFFDQIPNKIDDKYYFRWILQIFQNQSSGISEEYLIELLKRYKFSDRSDFDDFYLAMKNIPVVKDDDLLIDEPGNKIKVESNVDILSAWLDSCDDTIFQNNPPNSMFYMREIIFKTKNQELIDKMNNKFNLQLIKKQNEILTTNNNRLIIENPNLNNAQSKSKTIVNPKSNEGKTPLWIIIITLGGIFWGPWLFKKIFGCCYDFEDTVVPTNETDNQKSSNQNPMPNQDNNLEENLNKGEDEFA